MGFHNILNPFLYLTDIVLNRNEYFHCQRAKNSTSINWLVNFINKLKSDIIIIVMKTDKEISSYLFEIYKNLKK